MEFLELLETVRSDDASTSRLFNDAGTPPRTLMRSDPNYGQKLHEAVNLLAGIRHGRVPFHRFTEVMTTSDFPLLFGDILDRQLLAAYTEWVPSWPAFARRGTVRDFRLVSRHTVDADQGTLDQIGEKEPYHHGSFSEGRFQYRVRKYGRQLDFSWEAWINEDFDVIENSPTDLGRAARRSEERYAAELITDASGPDAGFYSVGNNNLITGQPPLSIEGLRTGLEFLASRTDPSGEPITIEAVTLVVPPALEIIALEILNATQLIVGADSATRRLMTANWLKGRLKIAVNPYIPLIATTANGGTSWFLFADPSTGRPGLEIGFLRGHLEPEVFMKRPDSVRIGGGEDEVDFDTDNRKYKVRHVVGGTTLDPRVTVASNGTP